jgi:methylenetetrahydrofolate reductase (NADPH)
MEPLLPTLDKHRYEVLPFGSVESDAAKVARPLTLTVTCSPRRGNDHTVDVACSLRELGHTVIVHLAARMVSGPAHLDSLLSQMTSAGLADVFLIGGDTSEPAGPYASALDLLPALRDHAHAPRTIGVAAYPEGHPQIAGEVLLNDLLSKDRLADYMTTQLCFDATEFEQWLERTRAAGVRMPVYVGLPGVVDRRRLVEISLRVGVGASISYVRKHRGLHRLGGGRFTAIDQLYRAVSPLVGGELGIAGFHLFTFNRLVETERFVELHAGEQSPNPRRAADRTSAHVKQERTSR